MGNSRCTNRFERVSEMETKKQRIYALAVGVCFIIIGVLEGIHAATDMYAISDTAPEILPAVVPTEHTHSASLQPHLFCSVLVSLCACMLGVLWLTRKRTSVFGYVLCGCVYCVAGVVSRFSARSSGIHSGYGAAYSAPFNAGASVIYIVAFGCFLLLFIATFITKPGVPLHSVVYFAPAILSAVTIVGGIGIYSPFFASEEDMECLWNLVKHEPVLYEHIFILLALLMSGLWLKGYGTTAPKKESTAHAPAAPLIGRAEHLQQYKDLLDAGVLTQAEFDAKKAEILHP